MISKKFSIIRLPVLVFLRIRRFDQFLTAQTVMFARIFHIDLSAVAVDEFIILNLLPVIKTIAADHAAAGKGFIRHRAIDDAFFVQQLQNPMHCMFFRGDDTEYFVSLAIFVHPEGAYIGSQVGGVFEIDSFGGAGVRIMAQAQILI